MGNGKGKYYVTNKELLHELKIFYDTGVLTDKLHLKFYEMAENIATLPKFSGYTWIEDWVSDAYLKCIEVVIDKKFKLAKGNPFSYFTSVIRNYFWDARASEKKQKAIMDRLRDEHKADIYYRHGIEFKTSSKINMDEGRDNDVNPGKVKKVKS
jgi:hypothetical protein